jgi:hypothetical protein
MLAEATPTASFPASPTVRFTPRKINARAHGRWIQARLVLPQGMSAADIDTSTVTISDVNGVPATLTATRTRVSLETTDAPSSLCMKFGRRAFVALLDKGRNVVTLSWATADGTPYSASATVCVTGKKHHGGGHQGSGGQVARGRGHGRH